MKKNISIMLLCVVLLSMISLTIVNTSDAKAETLLDYHKDTKLTPTSALAYSPPTPTSTPQWDSWITYDPNGGEGGGTFWEDHLYPDHETFTVRTSETAGVSRRGYVFVTWNSKADGSGDNYLPGTVVRLSPIIFFAIWTPSPSSEAISNPLQTISTSNDLGDMAIKTDGSLFGWRYLYLTILSVLIYR